MVRFKKRYIVIEVKIQSKHRNEKERLWGTLYERVREIHGDFGAATIDRGFRVKYVNKDTDIAIISVGRSSFPLVASSLPFIDKVGKGAAQIRSLHSSASFKHSLLFIKKHHEKHLRDSKEGKKHSSS